MGSNDKSNKYVENRPVYKTSEFDFYKCMWNNLSLLQNGDHSPMIVAVIVADAPFPATVFGNYNSN